MINNTTAMGAWEMTADYRTFVEAVLDAKLQLRPAEVYALATRIMADPLIVSRYEPLLQAWWATGPYKDLEISDDPDPNAPDCTVKQPNFYLQVAEELSRAERLELRKKYGES
jgi:hypothetical protein